MIQKIPRVIHYCWFGGKPLPELAQKCIASWRRFCPDYEIKRWDETNYDVRKNAFMAKACQQKKWGFVPDYARLDIIHNYGGIYLDTDVEMIKPFDDFLQYPAFCGFESEYFINFGLGFGAEKGNPVIKTCMQPYETLDFEIHEAILRPVHTLKEIQSMPKEEFVPSPRVQTQSLVENYHLKQNNTRQSLDGIEVFPTSYFCPMDPFLQKATLCSATHSIHHFEASWWTEEMKYERVWYQRLYRFLPKKAAFRMAHWFGVIKFRGIRYIYQKIYSRVSGNDTICKGGQK